VHGPGLSGDDCAGREGVTHKVEGLISGSVLRRTGGDDAFEKTGSGSVNTKTFRQD